MSMTKIKLIESLLSVVYDNQPIRESHVSEEHSNESELKREDETNPVLHVKKIEADDKLESIAKEFFAIYKPIKSDEISDFQENLRNLILKIRNLNYTHLSKEPKNGRLIVIDFQEKGQTSKFIDENEGLVQALRYFDALLLVIKYHKNKDQIKKVNDILSLFENFFLGKIKNQILLATYVEQQCAKVMIDMTKTKSKESHKLLTFARDLVQLSEPEIDIITIVETSDEHYEIQSAESVQIDEQFHASRHIKQLIEQGKLLTSENDADLSWIDHCLADESEDLAKIKAQAHSTGSTSRFSILPANLQKMSFISCDCSKGQVKTMAHSSRFRLGTTTPVALKTKNKVQRIEQQQVIATEQLERLIKSQLEKAINDYLEKYKFYFRVHNGPIPFFFVTQ